MAEKLLKLYAIRENTEGYSFNSDNDYQRQFEDDFAYIETNDQLLAIEDVKKDMESSKVMDRLLCGDVGFGKTEVAIRAAFKAVQDNKQVAILAPTTILVEQHYKTFKQRMKDYPINIEYISRFRTEKEINNAIEGLRKGTVDIIIGTHKLLNDKIEFKDLGLLILDEEQRFGVEQKEKIKSKAENVDTLSMSATPIPRTLHMSMSGIRDISLLEEAPRERRPVQTYVMERNEELIKNAIYKEVARNGQVFYLFNRVKGIQKLTNDLRKLMPELRIEYAHGTMPKTEMEAVMREFIKGNIDVLVSTTIIETGIDIPNANTMLVEDADKMGLAQLYQLKGRVGREKRTAFCYFMYEEGKVLSDEADKRLTALKQFTELGSGLKIAMTDLEIRGAGNLIGVEQSGKLGLVGYDLYCKLLEDAIAELKGERVQRRNEIKMNLKIDAYIDEDYIKDSLTKVGLYKRIASIESQEELEEILNELKDRFGTNEDGEVPSNVVNLLYVALLKSQVRKLNVRQVDDKDNHVVFTFEDATEIPDEITSRLLLLGQNREDKFRFDFKDPLSTKLYYKESYDEITNERLLVTNLIDLISDITEGNDLNNYFKQNEEKEDEENKPKGIRMRKIRKN
ncbi:MAG: DEAD/DEAH box helicase [Clostridia bacterium]|nr:DEAD/DEAH box helicase [Clostridia bacterium]